MGARRRDRRRRGAGIAKYSARPRPCARRASTRARGTRRTFGVVSGARNRTRHAAAGDHLLHVGYRRGELPSRSGRSVSRAGAVARLARASGWPVLADAISGARIPRHAVSTYEALLRAPRFAEDHQPDVVLRVGGALTSKVATEWLDRTGMQIVIDPDGAWLDPQ